MYDSSFKRLLKQKNKSNDIVRKLKQRNVSMSDAKFTIEYNDEVVSVADSYGNSWYLDYTSSTYSMVDVIEGIIAKAGCNVESKEL